MKLSEFVDMERGRQTDLAAKIGCQPQLLWQWARGVRETPLERCVAIERATGLAVRRWDLRPKDWHMHWPELIGAEGAPPVPDAQPQAA